MHHKSITVRLINLAGEVLGHLSLPATFRLIDLDALSAFGAVRVEVVT